PANNQALAGFRDGCAEQVKEFDLRGSKSRKDEVLKEIRAAKPKIVVAVGPLAAQVAKEGLPDLPVLFLMVSNPRKYGLEGANIAGVSLDIHFAMQFTNFTNVVPGLKTIGVIY